MKLLFAFLFVFPFLCTVAQPKLELGLTTEASWVMKKELTMRGLYGERHNWGTGLEAYVSAQMWRHLSVSSGLGYRYSEIQKGEAIWTPHETLSNKYLSGFDYSRFPRHYLIVPFNLQLLLTRNGFITGGVEYCRILNNYSTISCNPEYNWTIGVGSQKHKLKWSLQYLRGFEKQRIQNDTKGTNLGFVYLYQTNRLQFKLSYPLLKSK